MKPIENDGKHVADIIQRTDCRKHSAEQGDPCFSLPKMYDRGYISGLCNRRVKRAGYDGKISQSAFEKSTPLIGRRGDFPSRTQNKVK